jgi:hypothetical protein
VRWSTLILVVVAIVAVIGMTVFVFPWEWTDDLQRDWRCAGTSYEKYPSQHNIDWWYDPDIPAYGRRLVHDPFDPDGLDWKYIDDSISFSIRTNNPENLYDLVKVAHESENQWVTDASWLWFSCTICATQGVCG